MSLRQEHSLKLSSLSGQQSSNAANSNAACNIGLCYFETCAEVYPVSI